MKNYGMSITMMKAICENKGSYYFTPDTVKFWGSKVHDAPNRWGLFVESHKSFDGEKRLYCVKSFLNGNFETVEPSEIAKTYEHFGTLAAARRFREKLSKALDSACECYRESAVLDDLVEWYEDGFHSGIFTLMNSHGENIKINTNNFDRFICG